MTCQERTEAEPRRLNKSMKEAQSKELRMAAKEQLPCYTGKKIINTYTPLDKEEKFEDYLKVIVKRFNALWIQSQIHLLNLDLVTWERKENRIQIPKRDWQNPSKRKCISSVTGNIFIRALGCQDKICRD